MSLHYRHQGLCSYPELPPTVCVTVADGTESCFSSKNKSVCIFVFPLYILKMFYTQFFMGDVLSSDIQSEKICDSLH